MKWYTLLGRNLIQLNIFNFNLVVQIVASDKNSNIQRDVYQDISRIPGIHIW